MSCQKMIVPMPLAFPSAPCKCWPSLLDVTCWVRLYSCVLVGVVAQSLKPVKRLATANSVGSCCVRLHVALTNAAQGFLLWKRKQSKEKLIKIHLLVWVPIYAGWQVLDHIRESGFRNRKFLLVEPEYPSRNWIWKPTSDWNPDWKSNT